MIIDKTTDMEAVRNFLTEPAIWEAISGDFTGSIEEYSPESANYLYIMGYDKLEPIGLFIIHKTDLNLFQCHVQVIPEHRDRYAVEFGSGAVKWVWDNTELNKLIALIPEIYPNVHKFAEVQGFKQEGYITNSYKKNGKMYSQWLMTIDRGE